MSIRVAQPYNTPEPESSPLIEVQTEKVEFMNSSSDSPQSPNWFPGKLHPFRNLRWRLTFIFIGILGLCLVLINVLIAADATPVTPVELLNAVHMVSIVLFIFGTLGSILLIRVLLHPLETIKDTSYAIAFGDLEQRARLPRKMDDEVGVLAINIDKMVDQIERARKEQQTSEQRARRFISDASHELRTPLTSLRGFTEVLMRGAKDDPETMRRVLKLMRNEAERMTRLVNDMLTLARLDDGKLIKTQKVDLVDLAVECVEQAKLLVTDQRKISLDIATDERLLMEADPDRLKQVMHILLDNAIKYGRPAPDGWIALKLDRAGDQLLIQVIDNGKGIPAEDLSHIFDRFYRGQYAPLTAAGTPVPGAGLGLAIARAIVNTHKGSISVHSDSQTGTVFTVALPCEV